MLSDMFQISVVSEDNSQLTIDIGSIEIVPTMQLNGGAVLGIGSLFKFQNEMFSILNIDSWFDLSSESHQLLRLQYTVAPVGQ